MKANRNDRLNQAFRLIYSSGSMSRRELAEAMGITQVTAGKIADSLLKSGQIVQFTRISADTNRESLHLMPNKKLHFFLLDLADGILYSVDICGNATELANFGTADPSNIFDKYISMQNSANEIIARQKYKNKCIGIFITGSDRAIKCFNIIKDKRLFSYTPVSYSRLNEILCNHLNNNSLSVTVLGGSVTYAYKRGSVIMSGDLSDILLDSVTLEDRLTYARDDDESADVLAREIFNLNKIFDPDHITVLNFSKATTDKIENAAFAIDRDLAEKLRITSDESTTALTVRYLIEEYIGTVG